MPDPGQDSPVRILSPQAASRKHRSWPHWFALIALVVVVGLAGGVISRVPPSASPNDVDPLSVVRHLRDAFDAGAQDEILGVLTDDAVLTWPAGPPWDGPLSGSVELKTDQSAKQLRGNHIADLDDFLAFHEVLNGTTTLERCQVTHQSEASMPWRFDGWVTCDFSLMNDLLATLVADTPGPDGQIRFAVTGAEITAVLVDSWDVTFPAFDYMQWVKDERPASYDAVFAGRFTLPRYGADTARQLLDLASDYATAG